MHTISQGAAHYLSNLQPGEHQADILAADTDCSHHVILFASLQDPELTHQCPMCQLSLDGCVARRGRLVADALAAHIEAAGEGDPLHPAPYLRQRWRDASYGPAASVQEVVPELGLTTFGCAHASVVSKAGCWLVGALGG